jgi:hypothetical protein
MIPRSYSRDLALQLNFVQDALYDREDSSRQEHMLTTMAKAPHPVLFGFAGSRIDTQMSFNIGYSSNS